MTEVNRTQSSKVTGRSKLDTRPNYLDLTPDSILSELHKTQNFAGLNRGQYTQAADVISKKLIDSMRRITARRSVTENKTRPGLFKFQTKNAKTSQYNRVQDAVRVMKGGLLGKKPGTNPFNPTRLAKTFLFGDQGATLDPTHINVGHTKGSGVRKVETINQLDSKNLQGATTGITPLGLTRRVRKDFREVKRIDAKLDLLREITQSGKINQNSVVTIIENAEDNTDEGRQVGAIITELRKFLTEHIDLTQIKGSDSTVEMWDEYVEEAFLVNRFRARKTFSSSKRSTTKNVRVEGQVLSIKGVVGKRKRGKGPGLFTNLLSLRNIINANMHDVLKERVMGKGGATELLNYRTGRFARSAKISSLTPKGKFIEARAEYMRLPYDVFSTVGHLYKPDREPRILIHRSIRETLKTLGLEKLPIRTVV